MSKIQNPIVIIHKRENSDTYAVAVTSGSHDFHDAVLMATMEPDMNCEGLGTWSKTGYYMAAEIERLKQAQGGTEPEPPGGEKVQVVQEQNGDYTAGEAVSKITNANFGAGKLPFEQWLSQQIETIDVDCGCVTTEAFYHWLRLAYEAGNSPVTPDGWVAVPKELLEELRDSAYFEKGDYKVKFGSHIDTGRWKDEYEDLERVCKAVDALLPIAPDQTDSDPAGALNDVTAGKPLTITLPDTSSKAFWSGTGKSETFHPETYKRWAKEAIERDCAIAGIEVRVK